MHLSDLVMNNLTTKILAVVAVGVLTLNCVLATAQVYAHTGTWANGQPGRTDYGYGYAGVDSTGRLYGNAVGNGVYYAGAYDANGRRVAYGEGYGTGYNRDLNRDYNRDYNRDSAFSYGRPDDYGRDGRDGYYGRNRYGYGYWNSAISTQKTGCVYWLTLGVTVILALKVFA